MRPLIETCWVGRTFIILVALSIFGSVRVHSVSVFSRVSRVLYQGALDAVMSRNTAYEPAPAVQTQAALMDVRTVGIQAWELMFEPYG